jgi:Transcriptional regulator containing an amidase domain and an AraC-type DNA-binding HTH domain
MAFPFWRLYYNTVGNASVIYKGITTFLRPDQILIIPPNTSFSTSLHVSTKENFKESIVGKKIIRSDEIAKSNNSLASDHLFIHFNLGIPYDLLEPGIYAFPVERNEAGFLNEIKEFCISGENTFDFQICTSINSLILGLLKRIPRNKWETPNLDKRVSGAITYIEQHVGERLTNKRLSDKANMVENSFARLFRENTGISIQQYIKKKRIEKALILLHHSSSSIEEIATTCGFSDRYHFSKVFKELMEMSPVSYKKHLIF